MCRHLGTSHCLNKDLDLDKRTYQFDIVAKELEDGDERDLVYVIRFQYPKKSR